MSDTSEKQKGVVKQFFSAFRKEIIVALAVVAVGGIFTIGKYFANKIPAFKTYKENVVKINGLVFETKKSRMPIVNAVIRFLNSSEAMTDKNGYFTANLKGTAPDSVTLVVKLPDGQTTNRKIFINYEAQEIFLRPVEFPDIDSMPLAEITDTRQQTEMYKTVISNRSFVSKSDIPNQKPSFIKELSSAENIATKNNSRSGTIVTATDNGMYDPAAALQLKHWTVGELQTGVVKATFISGAVMEQTLVGDMDALSADTNIKSAKYLAFIKKETSYKSSSIDESLKTAVIKVQIVVVDLEKSEIIYGNSLTEKASDISEEIAKKRAEDAVFNYLKKVKLKI